MQYEVKVPSLGESIVSGVLTQWSVSDGDYVKAGDALYELETDKITSEGIADVSGKIKILANVDDEVEIGQVIANIDETVQDDTTGTNDSPTSVDHKKDAILADKKHPPSVERLGALSGIDPDNVSGTGKDGRVTKADMLYASESPEPVSEQKSDVSDPTPFVSEAKVIAPDDSDGRVTRKKMTPMRKRIAERLVSVKNESAILTTFNEVDMSSVMKLRKEMQEEFIETHSIKLGFMSFFVKAVVQALKAVPSINAQIEGDDVVTNHYYDLGVAVGTPKGLVVPVLRDCDRLSFSQIEQRLFDYAQQARDGKIGIEDLQGGVFTISNGGVYGSLLSTPIINPPQSGILGMHSIQDRPVAINGKVEIRPMMYLALSYDHRIVDGKEAVTFLLHIKKSIENPSRLLFGL